ncbi:sensor histidine kinase [Streptomyces sp. NPDC096198]|uniref:sensor histidine kinase n=1 Tax=Streptomyces sp. NPDC096198 TaxID=3366080 RepID=UPI0037F95300
MIGHLVAFTPVALAVAMHAVGTANRRRGDLFTFGVAGCITVWPALYLGLSQVEIREVTYSLAFVIGPLAAGYAIAVRRDLAASVAARLTQLERERLLLADRARAEERAAIAREMHDVVGHRVSNIVLSAGALEVGEAAGIPAVARAAECIRTEGRLALEELREVLGVLTSRHAGASAPLAPQSDASRLSDLVERARWVGRQAELHVEGFPEMLPAPLQRALYRIVQESLTNAAKHAPEAPVHIDVDCRADGVHVRVCNPLPIEPLATSLPSGGNGLVGLAERVALLGGTFQVDTDDGVFTVTAVLPHHTPGQRQPDGAPHPCRKPAER